MCGGCDRHLGGAPPVLESSDELFDALDDGLELVEQKTIQAAALASKIQAGVAPIVGEVTELAEKADSRPEDEKILNRIRGELSEHLGQVDALAEIAETAVALLTKTTQLTKSLRLPASRISAGQSPEESGGSLGGGAQPEWQRSSVTSAKTWRRFRRINGCNRTSLGP